MKFQLSPLALALARSGYWLVAQPLALVRVQLWKV